MTKASALMTITNRSQLLRNVEQGVIHFIGYGFYAHPAVDPIDAYLLVVATYYPRAVVANRTALYVHRLTDERVDQIDVDVPNDTTIKNSFLCVHQESMASTGLVPSSGLL